MDGAFHTCSHSKLPHVRVDSECKRWNVCCVSYTGAHHRHDSTLPVSFAKEARHHQRARAHPRQSHPCRLFLHVIRQFHRLHSEWGQMTNATAINAVPVLEDVCAGTAQWSVRLNVPQHGQTHQVLTHS